ncbi:tyrosine-protein phosphatase non-receptor type substrate 1-like [Ornithorhynchus anatinus]|uniref:tyrosine-protein phosphatase non-receptor type substrate 1-like n=1 Tax=Ornithorhynchus anatinus TaxID=9258 RepID=UPI0019D4C185|nr:tyrosine-protein phosphatase non-receptor type substrate 1-like [Ornithorhynchus anatinus]
MAGRPAPGVPDVRQPARWVSAPAGGRVTLPCLVEALEPPGPVLWFRGSGPARRLVYGGRAAPSPAPRVARLHATNRDFSIRLDNVSAEDEGTYFCVKFRARASGPVELGSGPGTRLLLARRRHRTGLLAGLGCFLLLLFLPAAVVSLLRRTSGRTSRRDSSDSRLRPRARSKGPADRDIVYVDLRVGAAGRPARGPPGRREGRCQHAGGRPEGRSEYATIQARPGAVFSEDADPDTETTLPGSRRPRERGETEAGPGYRPSEPEARPLPLLLLAAALLNTPGGGGGVAEETAELEVRQPPGPVSAAAGETVTLNCTLTALVPPGPVRWYRGNGTHRWEIYNFKEGSFPRVTPATLPRSGAELDFSVRLRSIAPADAGTYYCVRFRRGSPADVEFRSGGGTELTVSARPSRPVVTGPTGRLLPGQEGAFTCRAGGFSPRAIGVTWFKNGNRLPAAPARVSPSGGEGVAYEVASTVRVRLAADDVRSQVICEVAHSTLQDPLRGSANLSRTLRVPPEVSVRQMPGPRAPPAGEGPPPTVTVACLVSRFYPAAVRVSWLENGTGPGVGGGGPARPRENKDGTFSLESPLQLNASALRTPTQLTCLVEHDGQPPARASLTLRPASADDARAGPPGGPGRSSPVLIVVSSVCALLSALLVAAVYAVRLNHRKAKGSMSSTRLHQPEKITRDASQAPEPQDLNSDITYADLSLPRGKPSPPPARPPPADDTLAYADLDMVHLDREAKKAGPKEESPPSEYACVHVRPRGP